MTVPDVTNMEQGIGNGGERRGTTSLLVWLGSVIQMLSFGDRDKWLSVRNR